MEKSDVSLLDRSELEALAVELGEKPFRGKQIFEWIYNKNAGSFEEMSNISKKMRRELNERCFFPEITIVEKLLSADNTTKYLFSLGKNYIIEGVLLHYDHGNAVCISTQAGCRMGCAFCASALPRDCRNLSAYEMLSQVVKIQKDCGERVSNVVLMGSGEPFDNYENVIGFIRRINSEEGLNIGQRHLTVSTCGIVPRIYDFAKEGLQVNLAVSLHAPNDNIRREIMPVAKKYSIDEILSACENYAKCTKRRVTFEYAMFHGLNDSDENAAELGKLLKEGLYHVNLIPANGSEKFKGSARKRVERFAEILTGRGVETTIRRKLGSDINAACGQLVSKYNTNHAYADKLRFP